MKEIKPKNLVSKSENGGEMILREGQGRSNNFLLEREVERHRDYHGPARDN